MKVLIVDDIETNRKLLRVNLQAEGIETCEAADGIEALAALKHEKADVIISDILMPNMDGYSLCQAVRQDAELRGLLFIFYTSTYTSPGDEKLALDCGADFYFKKPAVTEILKALSMLGDPSQKREASPLILPDEAIVMKEYSEALVRKLEARNLELEGARAENLKANEELERRVKERTAELLILNQELEAFSQSIAHDLRSPLTAIDGFSHILMEECLGKVPKSTMDGLGYISVAAHRMNVLTSDLLRLSRASRSEISPQLVDLSALILAIIQDFRTTEPERHVEFVGTAGVSVTADSGLLRIALENLLNNAWKYTGKITNARIEFGVENQSGKSVFFIRDNGAGFDMAHAEKLFTNFGRLHATTDFAGTGIGLCTVQRIITRHGGRIWTQAAPDQGATFFFTLGSSPREPSI